MTQNILTGEDCKLLRASVVVTKGDLLRQLNGVDYANSPEVTKLLTLLDKLTPTTEEEEWHRVTKGSKAVKKCGSFIVEEDDGYND